jgi:signal peptidase II
VSTRDTKTKWVLAVATAAAALALDLLSKRIVQSTLVLGQPGIPGDEFRLLPFLTLQRASNHGVAFGLLSGRTAVIVPAACLALVLVIVYMVLEPRPLVAGIAGGMLIGGSLGNLVERVTQGHVTDFLRLPHYPTFNLADIFIVVGVVLVAVSLLWTGTESRAVEGAPNG